MHALLQEISSKAKKLKRFFEFSFFILKKYSIADVHLYVLSISKIKEDILKYKS